MTTGKCVFLLTPLYKGKGKGAHEPKAQTARAYPGFVSMKHVEVLLLPPDGMLVHRRVTPNIMLPVSIYTPG